MASRVTYVLPTKGYTHQTSGLPGFPAIDVMLPAGTVVGAPEDGFIMSTPAPHLIPWNIAKRVGGWTEYFFGKSGRVYFLTHLASGGTPGQYVTAGAPIGTVAAVPGGAWGTHVHEGIGTISALMTDLGIARSTIEAEAKAALHKMIKGGGRSFLKDALQVGALGPLSVLTGAGPIPGVDLPGPDIPDVLGGVKSVGEAIAWLFDVDHLLRIGEVLLGVLMVLVGVLILARTTTQSETVQTPVQAVKWGRGMVTK